MNLQKGFPTWTTDFNDINAAGDGATWITLSAFRVDQCEEETDDCDEAQNFVCNPIVNDFECVCDEGYEGTDTCTDIDECMGDFSCPAEATCEDTEGSYTCDCGTGKFILDGNFSMLSYEAKN